MYVRIIYVYIYIYVICGENSFIGPPRDTKISTCRAFNPPNPYEGRKQDQDGWNTADYLIPIGRFFTRTWRKRDVRWRCGESRWINLCLVTSALHPTSWSRTFSFDILSESIVQPSVPSYSLEQSRRINNYVCCARNTGGLINRLSAFTWGDRDRDINKQSTTR